MPIPNKKSGETENEYIGRCMIAIGDEYDTKEQALAVCYNKFRTMKKNSVLNKINNFKKDFEGINISLSGEVDLKEPCWDGYEQIGTKMLNGREVPNCVPID